MRLVLADFQATFVLLETQLNSDSVLDGADYARFWSSCALGLPEGIKSFTNQKRSSVSVFGAAHRVEVGVCVGGFAKGACSKRDRHFLCEAHLQENVFSIHSNSIS
jgi:hypothetical protein